MKKIFFKIFILISIYSYSQDRYEYFGALKLNGNDKTIITYRLVFTEADGKINGYSITDLNGTNETKNSIIGTYNNKTKELVFKEDDILYTKSKFTEESFCFVNFSGKVKLSGENTKIEGNFKGLFNNKTKCIDGILQLVGSAKIYKTLNKLNNKIQKSKQVDEVTKQKVNPLKILDSMKVNNMIKDQNLNVFFKSTQAQIEIWDDKTEDGDIVNLYQNDKLILEHYMIISQKKRIKINLDSEKTIFRIEAISEGDIKFNTAMIQLIDQDRIFELSTYLKKGEKTEITIIKKIN
jgi:hypothetical protein